MPVYNVKPGGSAVEGFAEVGCAPSSHFQCVDDPIGTPDEDATHVRTGSTGSVVDTYTFLPGDVNAIPALEPITQVVVKYRYRPSTIVGDHLHRAGVCINGTDFFGPTTTTPESAGGVYGDFSNPALTVRPSDSQPFIRENLFGFVAISIESVSKPGGVPRVGFTQAYLEVTTGAPISKLRAIKNYLVDQTSRISGIGSFGSKLRAWHEVVNYPAVYCVIGSETKEPSPTRSKEATAQFILPTVVKSEDPLDTYMALLSQIETAIEDDPSLDGLALNAHVSGFNALVTSATIAGQVHVADVFVDVTYRHTRGAP